ncbi:amidase [Tenggerimyces flavus]|uniref:Amidase n=1 Tax=Tenggerimyces flavus TaxID=1708749 RepID=A0ABV7Y7W2_9ACTN|nr:amidase [Tenggerimyces flavus]MBM7788316.1 amidase [Tenggerimyces flavus]
MTELCDLTASELARRIRTREASAREVLDAQLARIDEDNPSVNAVVSLDPEVARAQAEEADKAVARGDTLGALHGVPMTLKDALDVAGLRTTVGTPDLDRIAAADGTVAARLRAAGANLIGHTNVPTYLADYQTGNELFGRTNNPWDLTRSPGGSSGGATAAVATGMTPLEYGSDLAGSIRLPAAFCGVYGLRPTEHRVSVTGFFAPPGGPARTVRIMNSLGPLARSLDDLHLALRLTAGPDGLDGDVSPVPVEDRAVRSLGSLRLAFTPALAGAKVANVVREQVSRVAAAASSAGAEVEEREPALDWDAMYELFNGLLDTITGGVENQSLAWYFEALSQRDRIVAVWETFFADVDALLLPAAMTLPFPHVDGYGTVDVDGEQVSYLESGSQLVFASLAGLPGLVVPAGVIDGLPSAVQLVGPRWSETKLLDIAAALEQSGALPGQLGSRPVVRSS